MTIFFIVCFFLFAANSVSMGHQWVNSEMKVSGSALNAGGTHFVKDASGIRPQFKPDVHASASQGPGKLTFLTYILSVPILFSKLLSAGRIYSSFGIGWCIFFGSFG